ncbi:RVT_3 domain-containing protein [Cephalotus follicularis]|uniref:RVT_3 domain-containing protein n=1 Tax=Cephalotus follicularis TaxID=3775 RepID=A0A1Q3CN71_CEPFO|nr:RVT_3 domain-containing protein [Cephalotus follicularis]
MVKAFKVNETSLAHTPRLVACNYYKLNTYGSARGNPGMPRAGGLIRNAYGNWIVRFTYNIGICSSIQVKLWGIQTGLQLYWQRQFSNMIVETDSLLEIHLINEAFTIRHHLCVLIDDYHSLLNQNWDCSLKHILREGNQCANFMANLSHGNPEYYMVF